MAIADSLLAELAHEANGTRRTLERVPEDRLGWKPHSRSMDLGALAGHIADIFRWGLVTLQQEEFDLAASGWKPFRADSRQGLLDQFESCLHQFQEALRDCPDGRMMTPWRLKRAGQVIFELPRVAVLRSMIFNHLVHHRAQLGVCLRLLDVPVPALYGPSADEQP